MGLWWLMREGGITSVGVEVVEVKGGGVAGGGCGRGELDDGAAGQGAQVEGRVDAVDHLVDGDVAAVSGQEAVVGEGVQHRAWAAACEEC